MQLNALHMRFGLIGAGVIVLAIYLLSGRTLGQPEVVQLDFGMYPEVFEGAGVEIDGKVVGKLEGTGEIMRAGFKVSRGKHVVRVLHPKYESERMEVDVSKPGQKVRLMLDLREHADASGRMTTAIGAQY